MLRASYSCAHKDILSVLLYTYQIAKKKRKQNNAKYCYTQLLYLNVTFNVNTCAISLNVFLILLYSTVILNMCPYYTKYCYILNVNICAISFNVSLSTYAKLLFTYLMLLLHLSVRQVHITRHRKSINIRLLSLFLSLSLSLPPF